MIAAYDSHLSSFGSYLILPQRLPIYIILIITHHTKMMEHCWFEYFWFYKLDAFYLWLLCLSFKFANDNKYLETKITHLQLTAWLLLLTWSDSPITRRKSNPWTTNNIGINHKSIIGNFTLKILILKKYSFIVSKFFQSKF